MTELDVRTIPGYVVHERLETTLVTATYLASRASDGYPVTLEVVTATPEDNAEAVAVRTAIDAIASIRHPVIPTIWEVGDVDGMPYTISNAIAGRTLAATLATRQRLGHDETLAVCTELADALELLASAGIVHGAISPCTVWITDRNRSPAAPHVCLRGFGAAALLPRRVRRVQPGTPPPDVWYLAPEQIDGLEAGDRADQYALACMTLHCLAGTPPFHRPTVDALFDAHLAASPDEPALHAGGLHRRVVDGLHRALAKDPADRFGNSMAFAAAIGGTAHRSWSWIIEEAARGEASARGEVTTEIDIRDDVGPADTVARSSRATVDDVRRAPPADAPALTARVLSEADWLPASANRTGPQRRVEPLPLRPADEKPAAPRTVPAPWRRWLGVALVVLLATAVALVLGPALRTQPRRAAGPASAPEPTRRAVLEIEAAWRRSVAEGPVTHLVTMDGALVGAADDTVISLTRATGSERWRTRVDGLSDVSTVGPIVVVGTGDGFTALDGDSGETVWRSADTGTRFDDFVTGRGRMFAVSTDRSSGLMVHAIDPRTGEVGWSIAVQHAGAAGTTGGPAAVAFDGSTRGGRSLYVAYADRLYSFDTTTRRLRWDIALPGAAPASLTAVGGAVLSVDDGGRLCRFDARDGSQAWSTCATLEHPDAGVSIVQVRNRRVVVAGTNEIMSVDFTSGVTLWRIVYDQPLQPAIASNRAATFIAAPDGTIEAVGQRTGASLWESAPFGGVSAMTATDRDVFVTTDDGRLTRLAAPSAGDGT